MTVKFYQLLNTESPFQQEAEKRRVNAKETIDHQRSPDKVLHALQVHQLELEMQNELLRLTLQSMEASRDRYLELFDYAPIAYLILTRDNVISEVNHTATTLLGIKRAQLIHYHFHKLIVDERPDFWHRFLMNIHQSGVAQSCELQMLRGDNSLFYAELNCQLLNCSTQESELRVALTDISQQKLDQRALAESQLRYAEIAHELSQPLTAISSYADVAMQLYQSGNPNPQKIAHILGKCVEQAQRAGQVMRQIESCDASININLLVRQAVNDVKQDQALSGFTIELSLIDDIPLVLGNEQQIQKVLVNLIRNGLESMRERDENAESLSVKTGRYVDDPNRLLLTVYDKGNGLPDTSAVKALFQPFYSINLNGLGMSLAMTHALVQANGGSLWAERNVNNRLSMHLSLPFSI